MSILAHRRAMADGPPSYAASSCSTTSGEGQSTDTHPTKTNTAGAKRRASRAGTRSVSTLTPAQLQRKRANDREAQRAIRQRNKEHIENLERRIEELSVGNVDAATLVNLRQRVGELEDELSKANQNLAASRTQQISSHPVWQARSNGDLVQPQVSYSGNQNMAMSARGNFGVPDYENHPTPFNSNHDLIVAEPEDSKDHVLGDDSDLQRSWGQSNLGLDQSSPMNFTTTAQYSQQVPSYFQTGYGENMNTANFMSQPSIHAYEIPIRYGPPTSIVDNLLIGVLQTQRRQILDGTIQAPASYPHLGALLKTGTSSPVSVTDPISIALSRVLHDYSTRVHLAETAAIFHTMHKLVQWQITTTQELYNHVPEWLLPRPIQLTEPHPFWLSFLVWPKLREKVIGNQAVYGTPEFSNIYTASLSVNWPYGESDTLVFVDGEVRVTPVFEKHFSQLKNWSLGVPFQQRYPELRDCCRFTDANYVLSPTVLQGGGPRT